MKVEIITTGDEILSGNVVDTNTAFLAEELWLRGITVERHTTIGDDATQIADALLAGGRRADVVIVTGGLGPTADDFTLEIAAKTFGLPMVLDDGILKRLQEMFAKRQKSLNEGNRKQAYVPQGAHVYPNEIGTAPGIGLKFKNTWFYFLPGVPKEMRQLFRDSAFPAILKLAGESRFFVGKVLRCFGTPESELDQALKDLYRDRREIGQVRVGFRAHFPETLIKLGSWHETQAQALRELGEAEALVRQRVGQAIYGEGEETLESVVGALLTKRRQTVSVAESCTGGMIADRFTDIPGASGYFISGVVSYSNEAKKNILGIPAEIIKKYGAVSGECALEMASHIRRLSRTDYGLAVTGIAGPGGGDENKPVGTVHVALSSQKGTSAKKYFFPTNREWFKLMVSSLALDTLRKELV